MSFDEQQGYVKWGEEKSFSPCIDGTPGVEDFSSRYPALFHSSSSK